MTVPPIQLHPTFAQGRSLLLLTLLLILSGLHSLPLSLHAQPSDADVQEEQPSEPPSPPFVPPPPPGPPPGPPPQLPPELRNFQIPSLEEFRARREARAESESTPEVQPAAEGAPSGPQSSASSPDERARLYSSALREFVDPDMNESVGIIRIPELGTNEVLQMLEDFTRKPILRQQNLPAVRVTFFSQAPMTRGEAILAIESLLSINGIAITMVGERFLKAVPAGTVNTQVPPLLQGSTLSLTPSQQVYSKLFTLNVLTNEEAVTLIQPLMTQGAPISFEKAGQIMVTDALINLQHIENLLGQMDRAAPMRQVMRFYPLTNIDAATLAQRLQALQQGSLKHQLLNTATFEADERSNQLFVLSHPSNIELIETLIDQFDTDVASLTDTQIFNIKHAEATEVATLIEEVITGQKQARDSAGGQTNAQPQRPRRQQQQQRPQQARTPQAQQAALAVAGEGRSLQFSDLLTLVADERANTIIANGTPSDLRHLGDLIEKIDVILAQVRIEVLITEVTLGDHESRGIDAFRYSLSRNFEAGGDSTETKDDLHRVLPSFRRSDGTSEPLVFGAPLVFGEGIGDFTFDVILNQVRTNSNIRVLSAPTIVTTHAREAEISVGESHPFPTSVSDSNSTTIDSRTNFTREDIGITLKVRPLIGSNGVIQLEIDQKVDAVGPDAAGEAGGIAPKIIIQRHANSYVSVANGQLIVLGGLQSVTRRRTEGKVFILGDIPVIGHFFRPRADSHQRTELLIFIRPVIMATMDEVYNDALMQLENIEGSEGVKTYLETNRVDIPLSDEDSDATPRAQPQRRRGGRL